MSSTLQRRSLRILGALVALVVALCCAGIGVATAAEPSGSIDLGVDGPTTTVTVDGTPIELIPATSYELPPETAGPTPDDAAVSPVAQESVAGSSMSGSESGIEVQGVSSSTGPTSSAGVGGPVSAVWYLVGAVVLLGAAALWLVRARRAARH